MVVISDQITLTHVVDVFKTIYYYKKQDESLNPPVKPASYSVPDPSAELTPPTGWTKTEPSYTAEETSILYVTVCTVYSDGDVEFSDVTVSSSFEAAKQAYAAASSASGNAASAMERANGKNKIYYTNNKASITGATVGDLCFETTTVNGVTGYNLWEYKPTTTASTNPWEKVTLGPGILTTGSIFANDINVDNLGAINAKMGFVSIGGGLDSSGKPINGKITITDTTGAEIGHWDEAGILAKAGEIGGFQIDATSIHTKNLAIGANNSLYLVPGGSSTTTIAGRSDSWVITSGSTFGVTKSGALYATAGEIGGFAVDATSIHTKTLAIGANNSLYLVPGGSSTTTIAGHSDTWVITSGSTFGVTKSGAVYATAGEIGGFQIDATSMHTKTLAIGANNSLYLVPGGSSTTTIAGRSDSWVITSGSTFGVTKSGALYATGATITGAITATSGTFGPANASQKISIGGTTYANINYNMASLSSTNNGFYLGTDGLSLGGGKFKVTSTGVATVSGSVTATSGKIGNFTLTSTSASTNPGVLYSGSHSSMEANSDGVYIGTDGISLGAGGKIYLSSHGSMLLTSDLLIRSSMTPSTNQQVGGFGIELTNVYGGNNTKQMGYLRVNYDGSSPFITFGSTDSETTVEIKSATGITLNADKIVRLHINENSPERYPIMLYGAVEFYYPVKLLEIDNSITFTATTDMGIIQGYNSATKYNILRNHGNGNVSLSACSGDLYLGYTNTNNISFFNNKATISSAGHLAVADYLTSYNGLIIRNAGLTKGTTPSAETYRAIFFTDKDGYSSVQNDAISVIYGGVGSTNTAYTLLRTYRATTANANFAQLAIYYPASDTQYAEFNCVALSTATDTSERYFRAKNSNGSIELNVSSGNKGVYDRSGGNWIIRTAAASTSSSEAVIPRPLTVQGNIGIDGADYNLNLMAASGSATSADIVYYIGGSEVTRLFCNSTAFYIRRNATQGNLLYLDGDGLRILKGNITSESSGAVERTILAENNTAGASIRIAANGNYAGLWCTKTANTSRAKYIIAMNASGSIIQNDTSDARVKNIIGEMSKLEAEIILKNTNIVNFTYKEDENKIVRSGLIAQNLRDVLTQNTIGYRAYLSIWSSDDEDFKYDLSAPEDKVEYGIDYSKLTPILWRGWQIHDDRINQIEKEIERLKAELNVLKGAA